MRLKRGNIKIAQWAWTSGGKDGTGKESFIEVPGLLGNHLGIATKKGEYYWSITHLKTGYQVVNASFFPNFKAVRAMVEELETAKGINWNFDDPKKVSKKTGKIAQRIIKKYCAF